MPEDFLIARNEEEGSSLPYLVRIPLGAEGIVLKVRETWPRTSKVYRHRAEWPEDAEVIEQIPTRSCTRRGAAIDLVLDRGRENRSQFVLIVARGREIGGRLCDPARWASRRGRRTQVPHRSGQHPHQRQGAYLLSALAGLPRAAVVVEDRYSNIFALKHVRPAQVADQLGECQARFRPCRSSLRRRVNWPRNGPIASWRRADSN